MVPTIRLALCQIDTVVGDIEGNVEKVLDSLRRAEEAGADLAAFPELAITGYPPEDLVLKPAFVSANQAALDKVARSTGSCAAVVGFVDRLELPASGRRRGSAGSAGSAGSGQRGGSAGPVVPALANAVALCLDGKVAGVYHKRLLPNYGVFDERRWFSPGTGSPKVYDIAGVRVSVSICEDLWVPGGPVAEAGKAGADLVVNVNASPFSAGRQDERLALIEERVRESGCAIAYVNQVGGQDELVFDGGSVVIDASGQLVARASRFSEELLVCELSAGRGAGAERGAGAGRGAEGAGRGAFSADPSSPAGSGRDMSPEEEVYEALVLGTRDYLAKNGFTNALIGLSGGIDSSLVALVATDALGPEHVHGIAMPSRYSSKGSLDDAELLASNLGIELTTIPIEPAHATYEQMLTPILGGAPTGLADENLQSRLRGVLLMAVSNSRGWIVLTTGNKSEVATGYSTLYGDSAGGFAVIRDVPKTLVYRLAAYRNERAGRQLVPQSVLVKAPSAELRPDQRDDQALPPYETLDPILEALVEDDLSLAETVALGFDPAIVARVAQLVDAAEYKRRQSPPGVRTTTRAFGKDRRMPITNRYREPAPEPQGVQGVQGVPEVPEATCQGGAA